MLVGIDENGGRILLPFRKPCYGTSLYVIDAKAVIIATGGAFVKCATGYDLTQLIIGSEGTLGIITRITLRLLPMPPAIASNNG
jgi:glycolate oxidase